MRWIFRALGLVVVMAAIVLGALFFLPGERIARIAADQITKATGRQVIMSGDTKISLYPILGVSTGAVEIANADWSDAGPMLRADSLKIGVEPQALFGGDIRITGLEAVNPAIRLERARDGRVNWELVVEGVAPSGNRTAPLQLRTASRSPLTARSSPGRASAIPITPPAMCRRSQTWISTCAGPITTAPPPLKPCCAKEARP